MSTDDPEIIPPGKKRLPVTTDQRRTLPAQPEAGAPGPHGMVGSWLTGLQAEHEARAYEKIATKIKAQTAVVDAQTGLRDSTMKLLSKTGELEDFDKTLGIEKAERQSDRLARYDNIDYERDERRHKDEMAKRRRQREIEEEEAKFVEARRQKFTAEQGFENQQRLKDRNLRIWEKRKEARELDAHLEAEEVRSELRGNDKPATQPSSLDSMRAKAEEALMNALADGNDAEVERWQRVLDAFGE